MPVDDILVELGGENGVAEKDAAQQTLLEAMTQVREAQLTNSRNLQREVERMPFRSSGFRVCVSRPPSRCTCLCVAMHSHKNLELAFGNGHM